MTYAIAGVTGNTGKVVAEALLARGEKVRVIVRDPAKGEAWRARGAEVAVADLQDASALTAALRGARGAYLLVPPSFTENDFRAYQSRVSRALAAAVRESAVPHVVLLSSVGAQHASGTGPIAGLHETEGLLGAIEKTTLIRLRAGYFYENFASSLGAVRQDGTLPVFFPADFVVPMVGTRDIGQVAARLLVEGGAARTVNLATPRTVQEIADELTRQLGRTVTVSTAPRAAVRDILRGAGLSEDMAGLYTELTEGVLDGHVTYEEGGERLPSDEPLSSVVARLLAA